MAISSDGGIGIGPLGIVLAVFGVVASYLACLYGAELNQQTLVAFGFWTIISLLVAFVVDLLFKYLFILVLLFAGALWWTENPAFQTAVDQAKALRGGLCEKVPDTISEVPVKEWIC